MSAPMQMLLASGGDIITLNSADIFENTLGGLSTAGFRLDSDGAVRYRDDAQTYTTVQYNWINNAANAGLYETKWEVVTNLPDTTPAAAGTFVALSSARTWEEASAGVETCTFAVTIRRIADSAVMATANISLNVDGSP